jgi:hypothetical protein
MYIIETDRLSRRYWRMEAVHELTARSDALVVEPEKPVAPRK